jgi:bifunctional non-homologous end joining protein LigD
MAQTGVHSKLKVYRSKRNFNKTAEPRGDEKVSKHQQLAFVVHKHDASHLHYDLRLEVHGVMKSWAVPKGPSFDPKVKRLAVEVEDHPMSYNRFEGTIPEQEYGGGTVMLWDEGYYTVDDPTADQDAEEMMEQRMEKGKVAITFHGHRLKGSFTLLRTRRGSGSKPQWLLIKKTDAHADPNYDPVHDEQTSVSSDRSMEELAGLKKSARPSKSSKAPKPKPAKKPKKDDEPDEEAVAVETPGLELRPMLVSTAEDLPTGTDWVYEQKLDGVRVLAFVDKDGVALVSRLGKDKTRQFPEFKAPLQKLAQTAKGPLILDGEITAVDADGKPLGFQAMMGRIHLDDEAAVQSEIKATPLVFYIFDILLRGKDNLLTETWSTRREILEEVMSRNKNELLHLVPYSEDAEGMQKRSEEGEWEGLIAKDKGSLYQAGLRTKTWWKWRTLKREEFIIGGWTEPKGSRELIGSLLLGYYDEHNKLQYAGHAGSGFTRKTLSEVHRLLKKREQTRSPFIGKVETNSAPHWVKPEIVAEIRFKEWTADRKLRQGIFLGVRDDKRPQDIHGEAAQAPATELEQQIKALPNRSAELFVGTEPLSVSHLDKVYFPKLGVTKRDLLTYYASMMDLILPWMEGRPLVLKRFPDGIGSKGFYQQEPDEKAPGRVEELETEQGKERRLIGGDPITLLYLAQIGAISYDPWHARYDQLHYPDYAIIDLDPGEGTPFSTVRDVALACLDVLDSVHVKAAMKTSGATGIHLYLPLPAETNWESSRLLAELICTLVQRKVPTISTLERSVKKRPKGTVYLDAQQNYLTRSVAGVWSVRAEPMAPISTPISREDLENGVEPTDFTLRKPPRERHKLWEEGMAEPVVIERILRLTESEPKTPNGRQTAKKAKASQNARRVDKRRKKQ